MNTEESELQEVSEEMANGASWNISHCLTNFIDVGLYFLQQCISMGYAIYLRLTLTNMVIFSLKYVPTGVYTFKFIKNIYVSTRERLKHKQTELEDIQLQIQIVNTKLCVRDAEFNERTELLQREAERLRRVRVRVREVIAADETLRRALESAPDCDSELDMHVHATPQEDNEYIIEMLKGLKRDFGKSERNLEKMDCGEHTESDPMDQNSIYSSLSDMDMRQDCRVKIVKVTNVYKVAYLRHYIKQKRLRRANKRAALKKKMESIKKLLEDWQKTLSMVINNKLTILNIDSHPIDVDSQEAMGDYSKRRESDSDSDMRNDLFYDEYSLSWAPNPCPLYTYNYEDAQETAVSKDYHGAQDNGDTKLGSHAPAEEYIGAKCGGKMMMRILEETGSQMTIEEAGSETDDADCRDLVAI